MEKKSKNILTATIIISLTLLLLLLIYLIPGYSKPAQPNNPPFTLKFVIIFLIVDLVLIGIPAWLHNQYSKDYGKIKNLWFFVLFGAVTGALLGEAGNFIMIIPYAVLMFIYAIFYKKFIWWKVALTSYFAGIFIENIINRAPLQSSTLIWIPFFIYPYFFAKIWENRKKVSMFFIIKDLKYTFLASIIIGCLSIYLYFSTAGKISPPLIFLAFIMPFLIKILHSIIKRGIRSKPKT